MNRFTGPIKDIIPSFHDSIPPALLSHIESLFQLSFHYSPSIGKFEIARSHLVAYIAIDALKDRLSLPDPDPRLIPLTSTALKKLLPEFQENLKSALSPRRNSGKISNSAPMSPTKSYSPTKSSPLKKSRLPSSEPDIFSDDYTTSKGTEVEQNSKESAVLLDSEPSTPTRTRKRVDYQDSLHDEESPFNPRKKLDFTPARSSPLKKARQHTATPELSPNKLKGKKVILDDDNSKVKYIYNRKYVSIIDFINFANNFKIPAKFIPDLIQCFLSHKYKFSKKSEWLLACGLIHSAYIRVNHKLIQTELNFNYELINQLFQYQNGGLLKSNLQLWCKIVEDWIKDDIWLLNLEKIYMYGSKSFDSEKSEQQLAKEGGDWSLLHTFGSMITGTVLLNTKSQGDYYNVWSNSVLQQIKEKEQIVD